MSDANITARPSGAGRVEFFEGADFVGGLAKIESPKRQPAAMATATPSAQAAAPRTSVEEKHATALALASLARPRPMLPPARLLTRPAACIQPEEIRWLWAGRIARGKMTLIAGDPGLGKSMLTASLSAHVSTGKTWPDGGLCEPGAVLFVSAEDDPGDTIRPRLDAAGADPRRVHIVDGVETCKPDGSTERRLLSLRLDLDAVREAAHGIGAVRLIVVDPVSAYLDGADSHNNAEVRALLAPLAELAREVDAAIVCVTHLNKGSGQALYRATGSLAFVAAARAAFLVTRDQVDPERRLFLPLKNNIGKDAQGLSYRIEEIAGVPFVAWDASPVSVTADEALARPGDVDHEKTLADDAQEWLREILDLGPVPSDQIKGFARAAGYSWSTVRRAQANLGIRPARVGGAGGAGRWVWALPANQRSDQTSIEMPGG